MKLFTPTDIVGLRRKLGMNQTEFAALVGVTTNAVYLWEHGERTPRIGTMTKLNELEAKNGKKHK